MLREEEEGKKRGIKHVERASLFARNAGGFKGGEELHEKGRARQSIKKRRPGETYWDPGDLRENSGPRSTKNAKQYREYRTGCAAALGKVRSYKIRMKVLEKNFERLRLEGLKRRIIFEGGGFNRA